MLQTKLRLLLKLVMHNMSGQRLVDLILLLVGPNHQQEQEALGNGGGGGESGVGGVGDVNRPGGGAYAKVTKVTKRSF